MRIRIKLLAGTVAVAGIAASASSVVSAADEVPWYQRPATVGTGFVQGEQSAGSPATSASGRWVAFVSDSTAWESGAPVAQYRVYLRDRWTDTTTRIATSVNVPVVTTMSADGNLIAGVGRDGGADTPGYAWIHRRDNGQTVRVPVRPGALADPIVAINNDGYFISSAVNWSDPTTAPRMRAARILPDGSLTPPSVAARGDLHFRSITPSMQYAVAVRFREVAPNFFANDPVRIDLVTGAETSFLGSAARPSGDDRRGLDVSSLAISPDGRYVAMGWQAPLGPGLRLWDTSNGTVRDVPNPPEFGNVPLDLRAVLADGRTIFVAQTSTMYLVDPIGGSSQVLSRTYGGDPVRVLTDHRTWSAQVATDIDRVLICTDDALSPFDTNRRGDCYLKPFPPSPLAG